MKTTTLPVPAGFRERDKLKSRTIARSGFTNRGVIFTTSDKPSSEDFFTKLLVGTRLEHINLGPNDDNRFFEILGGYFFGKDQSGTFRTTQVFGICLDKNEGFEIEEKGTVILNDHWEIFHPKQPGLDERMNNDDGKPSEGWTLVVVPKNDFKVYPRSHDPLAIHLNCGEITNISVDYAEQTESSQSVAVNLEIDGPDPESFTFDWGDGTVDELNTASAVHTYQRGKATTSFTVNVSCKGPGPCADGAHAEVTIPAVQEPCPVLARITTEVIRIKTTQMTIAFKAEVAGNTPTEFVWDWGDGSAPEKTTSNEATHTFDRPKDGPQKREVSLQVIGPGDCKTAGKVEVEISRSEKNCPGLTRIDILVKNETKEAVTIEASLDISGVTPDSFIWQWGDGSPAETTNTPQATHTYQRSGKTDYVIQVEMIGPEDCKTSGSRNFQLPPLDVKCPEIKELKLKALSRGSGDEFLASFEATVEGKPDSYQWDWGDGSAVEETTVPHAKHVYQSENSEITYQPRVQAIGPGNCKSSAVGKVIIPAKAPDTESVFCRIMPYLVAFLGALLTASLLVCFVAEIVETGNNSDILMITGGLLLAFMVAVVIWISQSKKRDCIPGACEWLAVGWVSMLTGLGTSFFLIQCITSWQIVAIGFFLATAVLAFFWFKSCAPKAKAQRFFTYFITSAIAFLIGVYLIAVPVLTCV
jgi:hypothetical protein